MKVISRNALYVLMAVLMNALVPRAEATSPPTALTIVRGPGFASYVDLQWNAGAGPHTFRVYASTTYPVPTITPIYTTSLPGQHVPMGANPPYFFVVTDDDGSSGESGPSNTVGYTQVDAFGGIGNSYTPFGIAFRTWDGNGTTYGSFSSDRADIFTDQLRCSTLTTSDRVTDACLTGSFAWRNNTCTWAGTLVNILPGRKFDFGILANNSPRSIIICGEADASGNYGTTSVTAPTLAGQTSATCISWRDPRELPVNQLNLINDGFMGGSSISDSDRLLSLGPVDQGHVAWFDNGSGTFQGNLTHIVPGQAYYIENTHVGNPYTYNFSALLIP